jgi:hypothetical protein
MEGYCSTGQSPQRVVVTVEEEEEEGEEEKDWAGIGNHLLTCMWEAAANVYKTVVDSRQEAVLPCSALGQPPNVT